MNHFIVKYSKHFSITKWIVLVFFSSNLLANSSGLDDGSGGNSRLIEGSSHAANKIEAACVLLNKSEYEKQFSDLKSYLCGKDDPKCAIKSESDCRSNIACLVISGSGSGPNCSPCTPDWVFWRCETRAKDSLADVVLSYELCKKSNGRWLAEKKNLLGRCECGATSLFLKNIGCKSLQSLCEIKSGKWIEPADPKLKHQAFCSLNGKKLEFKDLVK